VRNQDEVQSAIGAVRRHFGAIDIVINDAGLISVGPIGSMTLEDFDDAMRTHFYGPLYTTLAVMDEFKRRGSGRIVNISSIGGRIAVPHLTPYSASKFALVGLSRGLRSELIRHGVYVTTVCPGLMRTGSPRNASFKGNAPAEYSWFATSDNIPVLSIRSPSAARHIVRAMKHGQAELVYPTHVALQAMIHSAFPGTSADILGVVNRMLPKSDEKTLRRGGDVAVEAVMPFPTRRIDEAAARSHNE
jgi:NAD(P)-dependent dehydrogenase (short-subunit alcohol dehydrogenase family)